MRLLLIFEIFLFRFLPFFLSFFAIFLLCIEQTILASNVYIKTTIIKNNKVTFKSNNSKFTNQVKPFFYTNFKKQLPLLSNGSMAMPSNANNFHGKWKSQVDSRTGNVSFSFTTAVVFYNNGLTKRDLILSWASSPVSTGPNLFGLGSHWRWNIATEEQSSTKVTKHLTTDILTSDGHHFTMVQNVNKFGEFFWHPLRHKLKDIKIIGQPGNWSITLPNGMREHILNGYEDWEETPNGKRIWFKYNKYNINAHRHLLGFFTNFQKQNLLPIEYNNNIITIHGRQLIKLHFIQNHLTNISIPCLSSINSGLPIKRAHLRFIWDNSGNMPWLLHKIKYPDDSDTTYYYNQESNDNSAIKGLATGMHDMFLPVVTKVVQHNSFIETPNTITHYFYGNYKNNSHNYTGFQGENSLIPGVDNLLDRNASYTYSTTMDTGVIKTKTIYNKYHLPLTTQIINKQSNNIIATTNNQYTPWKNTHFSQLEASWSLPVKIDKQFYSLTNNQSESSIKSIHMQQSNIYDNSGRVLYKRDALGSETFISYCPIMGDKHCPKNDTNSTAFSQPEFVLVIPKASDNPLIPTVNPQETIFNYIKLPINNKKLLANSRPKFFWVISKKIVTTLPVNITHKHNKKYLLTQLLSFNNGKHNTETTFIYDTDTSKSTYGQLKKLSVKQYPASHIKIAGKLLHESKLMQASIQSLTVAMQHTINTKADTLTTVTKIEPSKFITTNIKNNLFADNANLTLGTVVHSLSGGLKLESEDSLKTMKTQWSYDIWNRPIKQTVTPKNGGKPQVTQWAYLMSANEHSAVMTLPNGNQTKRIFSSENKTISTWHRYKLQNNFPLLGDKYWIPDTHIIYNKLGLPKSQTKYITADITNGHIGKTIALTTFFGYDILNRPVWQQGPDGVIKVTVEDDANLIQASYSMATSGNANNEFSPFLTVSKVNLQGKPLAVYLLPLTATQTKNGKPVYSKELQKKLKLLLNNKLPKNKLKAINSYGALLLNGNNGLFEFINKALTAKSWMSVTKFAYNSAGNKVQQILPNGAITTWHWQEGRLIATIFPDGRIIHDTFDIQGHMVKRCMQPVDSDVCRVLGSRFYNSAGNLQWQADSMGHIINYSYDADDRKTKMVTPNGHTRTWVYNALGLQKEYLDGKLKIKYTYNPITWNLTDKEDAIAHTHFNYDANTNNLIKITSSIPTLKEIEKPLGIHLPQGTEENSYNSYGVLIKHKDEFGNVYTALHDKLGRTIQTVVKLTNSANNTNLLKTEYDNFNRVKILTNGIGIKRYFYYNTAGELASTVDFINGKIIQRLEYKYNIDTGNIIAFTRAETGTKAIQIYTYDKSNNLTSMACTNANNQNNKISLCPRETNLEHSNLISPLIINYQKYTFDKWNNIQTVFEKLKPLQKKASFITKTTRYIYANDFNPNNVTLEQKYNPHKMLAIQTNWSNQPYNNRPQTLTYNIQGKIIKDAAGNNLHYNAYGQQDIFINAKTKEQTHYIYNSDGYQIAEVYLNNKGQQLQLPLYMFYQGSQLYAKVQNDFFGKQHTSIEIAGVVRSEDAKIVSWYVHDTKGDVINTFNNKGQQQNDNVYSPYGMSFNQLNNVMQTLPASINLKNQKPLWQSHTPGFDGEVTDPATGYQFLGGGYRAYNPIYRHFMSFDSLSPFLAINGYGFANNNPIMNTDPSGHFDKWVGYLGGTFTFGAAIATGLVFPAVVAVLGSMGAISGGVNIAFGVSAAITGVLGVTAGSLQITKTNIDEENESMKESLEKSEASIDLLHDLSAFILDISHAGLGLLISAGIAELSLFCCICNSLEEATLPNRWDVITLLLHGAAGTAAKGTGVVESSLVLSSFNKNDKAARSKINKKADIIKIISMSLEGVAIPLSIGPLIKRRFEVLKQRRNPNIEVQIIRNLDGEDTINLSNTRPRTRASSAPPSDKLVNYFLGRDLEHNPNRISRSAIQLSDLATEDYEEIIPDIKVNKDLFESAKPTINLPQQLTKSRDNYSKL